MQELVSDPVFQLYIGSTLLMGLNLLVLANNTALTRTKAGEVVNPEDKKLNAEASVVFEAANAKTERYRRAHRNALENIPLFLITGLLLVLVGTAFTAAAVLFSVFVFARLLHSVCYVRGIQPLRTLSFGIAALDQLVILGFLAYAVYF